MIDLNVEKKYIQEVEKKVRNLELEKVKLEQQKIYTERAISENLDKMQELGYTPDTIGTGIDNLYETISKLKNKINTILGVNEVIEDDSSPF